MTADENSIVEFDSAAYDIQAVKKAAYTFIGKFSVNLSTSEQKIRCELSFPENITSEFKKALIDDFQNEVLDQDLRKQIAADTESYRNAILALAFSSTKFTQSE